MSRSVLASVVLATMLLTPVSAVAKTYRWVDENGNVHYSDRPPAKPPAARETKPPGPAATPVPVKPTPGPASAVAPPAMSTPPVAPPRTSSPPTPPSVAPPRVSSPPTSPPVAPPRTVKPAPAPAPVAVAPPSSPAGPPPAARPAEARPTTPPSDPTPRVEEAPTQALTPSSPDALALAREVVELSGVDRYLENLSGAARAEFGRLIWRLKDGKAASQAVGPLFRRDVLVATVTEVLAQRLDSEHAPALVNWLRSPLYRRIQRLEVEASNQASFARYREFVARLPETGIPPRRLALVQQMERDSRAAEFQMEMERSVREALGRALSPLLPREHGSGDVGPVALEDKERARVEVLTIALFAYRSLSDAELEQYARFEGSAAGLWASGVLRASLKETIRVAERRASVAVKKLAMRRAAAR